nr:ATP-binding protein [bacterium]
VGRLAGGVAHDFNNLLTAIMGFVDLVLSELPEGSPYRSDLLEVEAAARRGGLLTRQLLAFSRKQTLFKKMLDLNRLVQGMEVMLRSLLSEDIEIDIDLDPELKNVRADAGQIEQVAMNLVINARDAMPAGGRLTVRTENVALDEESSREIRESRPGEFACLTVEDTGTGMSGEIQQRIFEPFFTTKGPEKGTGLGLSTVYGIVKQHGGWVNFYSEPKRGTVFRVYLPTLSTPAAAKARESFPSEYSPGKGERILLVEDNEGILKSQLRILQRAGYVVFGAGTAAEARDLFRREEGNFDLFFTDVVLPDGNGLELVEELRKRVPALRVLLSSGYIDLRENGDRIRELGLPFIEKPYQIRPLLNRIRAELDRPAAGP